MNNLLIKSCIPVKFNFEADARRYHRGVPWRIAAYESASAFLADHTSKPRLGLTSSTGEVSSDSGVQEAVMYLIAVRRVFMKLIMMRTGEFAI